ncbi:MAG TPA: hypothetical protein VK929_03625 [Longimicrobiales bacterium]|nr:hypothetical protein [Longimicrobiales bacterium]
MTDPDLIFDYDPRNVARVETWLAGLCPDTAVTKDGDGSRLTWQLAAPRGTLVRVAATEAFLSLPGERVDGLLGEARRVCDEDAPAAEWNLLLTADGVIAEETPTS